jgi:photosystem II stability/assembly factor-like uncharacterized protein
MRRSALLVASLVLAAPLCASERSDPLAGLEYRLVGPMVGGRVVKVSGVVGDPMTWYLAAAQGGVWKSSDGGREWLPIFDKTDTNSIGALAVAPSDANVIYVGGGEGNIRGNVQPGAGLFVSTDAGKTWKHTLKLRGAIGDIEVDPYNSDIAYAAVLGSAFASNPQRGVYRTLDSGKTWEAVLTVDADSGASDISIDANNPRIVWAGTWQARRTPWGMTSGGKGSGLWRSADGGDTWTRLQSGEHGLPKGDWGKVGVAVSPANSERIYALIEAEDGGLYRSDDGGEKFELVNQHRVLRQRAWYYSNIIADPLDADVAWFPQVQMQRTRDGGKTVQPVEGFAHGDHHDLWIDPGAPERLIAGNDGGVDLSDDGGERWHSPDLPLGQFYNIDVDQRLPYHVGGTLQDMGTVSGPILSLANDASALSDWRDVGGGEAGDFRYDLALPGQVYAGEYGGYLTRHSETSGQTRNISSWPANPSGMAPATLRYRFQWTAPIELSPHDSATIYHGANVLMRSRDRGETWAVISPDLTRNDQSQQQWAGGPITGDNTGVEIYNTIFSIDESPLTRGELWVGSDDGRVHVSTDDGAHWSEVTPRGLPINATVESLRASRHQAGRVYLVAHRYRLGDDRPMAYVSDDRGRNWRSLAQTLPEDMPLYSLVEDERDPALLYLGAERAIYASVDAGKHWQSIQLNLPPVAVVDMETAHNDLVIGTRGRGLYAFHDLGALRQGLHGQLDQPWLAPSSEATRWQHEDRWGKDSGTPNPPYGALISYYLPTEVSGELRLQIRDDAGRIARELSSVPRPLNGPADDPDEPKEAPEPALATSAGWHRVTWDLAYEGAKPLRDAKLDAGDPESGPLASPGRYQIELIGPELGLHGSVNLLPDPRSPADATALNQQLEFALQLRDAMERARLGIEWLRAAREQAKLLRTRLADDAMQQTVVNAADDVIADADRIEGQLHNPEATVVYDILRGPKGAQLYSQLAPLYSWSQGGDGAPTAAMRERHDELEAQLREREAAIAAMRIGSIAHLETTVAAAALPRLLLPPLRDVQP